MTRQEFEQICNWSDLLDFCREHDLSACEQIILGDDLDNSVDDDIPEALHRDYWYDIRDRLQRIEEGYPAYRYYDVLCYECLNDMGDFDYYKEMAANEYFGERNDDNDENDADEDEDMQDLSLLF